MKHTAAPTLPLANGSLHIEQQGHGTRTLVLLHGWAMNLRVFDALVAELARDFTVLSIDLPGHGRSAEAPLLAREGWTLPRLAAALRPHIPREALLLGWSLGGQIALRLALDAPDHVAGLALVSSTPRFVTAADWPHGIAPGVLNHFAQHLGDDWRDTVRDFLELQVRGSRDAQVALTTLHAALLKHGEAAPAVLARALTVLRESDLRAELGAVTTPTLVLSGQYDRVTPPGAALALAAALPHAQQHEFARCGHAPFLSHEQEFATVLRAFAAATFEPRDNTRGRVSG